MQKCSKKYSVKKKLKGHEENELSLDVCPSIGIESIWFILQHYQSIFRLKTNDFV